MISGVVLGVDPGKCPPALVVIVCVQESAVRTVNIGNVGTDDDQVILATMTNARVIGEDVDGVSTSRCCS